MQQEIAKHGDFLQLDVTVSLPLHMHHPAAGQIAGNEARSPPVTLPCASNVLGRLLASEKHT
jgi:hypothetical protein